MNQSKIPVRYSKALFLSGREKGIHGKLYDEVRLLSGFFEQVPVLMPWLRSPAIKMHEKKDLFRKQFGKHLSEITYRFLDLVISKKREEYFPDIFRDFIHLYKTDAGIKTITLTTAWEVDETIRQKVESIYQRKGVGGQEIVTRVKPSIIGGFMIQENDLLYDASISTELSRLKKELTAQIRGEAYQK